MKNITLFAAFFTFILPIKAQTVTDADGNIYNTVTIGTQVWMKENLKTTKYNDGLSIPLVTDNLVWPYATTGAYSWYYNDEATYKATYGALYNWYTVKTGKLCPTGWHVPSDEDWTTLIDYLGGLVVAGNKLKETGTTHWLSLNTGATNETGFTALGGSFRNSDGTFGNIRFSGYWWSATEESWSCTWNYYMSGDLNAVERDFHIKEFGFSVRCLMDIIPSIINPEYSDAAFFYPNPANGMIYVKNTKTPNSLITIFDLQGKKVFSKQIDSNPINISNLIQGVYIVKLENSGCNRKITMYKYW
jgi:uncharacterized protein (TIGR02145 family)